MHLQAITQSLQQLGETNPAWFARFEDLSNFPAPTTAAAVKIQMDELTVLLGQAPNELAAGIVFGQLHQLSEQSARARC